MNPEETLPVFNRDYIFAAAIQSFNRQHLLDNCLASILRIAKELDKLKCVIVYDAGSTDASAQVVQNYQSSFLANGCTLLLVTVPKCLSFAAGTNLVVSRVLAAYQPQFVLLYETDNEFLGSTGLSKACNFMSKHDEWAAVGFTAVRRSGERTGFACAFPTKLSFVLGQRLSSFFGLNRSKTVTHVMKQLTVSEVDVAFTSPLLVRSDAWLRVGGFDAETFPFTDCDLDLCKRLSDICGRVGVLHTCDVVHDNNGFASEWSASRTYRWHNSRFAYLAKHRRNMGPLIRSALAFRHIIETVLLTALLVTRRRSSAAVRARARLFRACWQGYPLDVS